MTSINHYRDLTDEALARLICAGQHQLFALIIDRYQVKITRYLNYLIFNPDFAADATQNTFIKAYTKLSTFDPQQTFSSWIYRIAHNEAMSLLRREKKHLTKNIALDEELAQSLIYHQEFEWEKAVAKETLIQAVNSLRENYKTVLILYYLEEKTYQEISDILQISLSNVGLRINRAKKSLFKILINKKVEL